MSIFAHRAGSLNIAGLLSNVICNGDPDDGDLLVWNDAAQAFIVQAPPSLSQAVTTNNTLGGANPYTIVGSIASGIANFKELKAGSGISLSQNSTSLTITSTLSANLISVPEDYRITIDNDNSGSNAQFQVWTSKSSVSNPVTISFTPTVASVTVDNVYSGTDAGSYFETRNGFDFVAAGFEAGQYVSITNAGDQTGQFQIADVENIGTSPIKSRITLVTGFSGSQLNNLGGPKQDVVFTQVELYAPDDRTLYAVTADFGSNGYDLQENMVIQITGTEDFDGNYTIDSVIDKGTDAFDYSQINLKSTTTLPSTGNILPEDLDAPDIEFEIQTFEESTGFYVTKSGGMFATFASVVNQPTSASHLTRKDYVDNLINTTNSDLLHSSGNIILDGVNVGSGNYLQVSNATTGNKPILSVAGIDANLGFIVRALGTSKIDIEDANLVSPIFDEASVIQVSTTLSIDVSTGNFLRWTLSDDVDTMIITGVPSGGLFEVTMFVTQDSVDYLFDMSSVSGIDIVWPDGVDPSISTEPNSVNIYKLYTFTGGTRWYGQIIGKEYV